ncbi:hypothetical protein J8273_0434 [Carpediemonas membranifera]|uniref:Uncharacterized protein n=1 Tax=Carpediemonas membranifera TaxID=201153 RepID=A0A8J6E0J6_9EUKA|nr:hypothetical protein J8273_0434 [Carpediemonas membranifera]|eukprot:KAG9395214.1 hypothetical protein J8273_0434 [Carpediemonas membranifera]
MAEEQNNEPITPETSSHSWEHDIIEQTPRAGSLFWESRHTTLFGTNKVSDRESYYSGVKEVNFFVKAEERTIARQRDFERSRLEHATPAITEFLRPDVSKASLASMSDVSNKSVRSQLEGYVESQMSVTMNNLLLREMDEGDIGEWLASYKLQQRVEPSAILIQRTYRFHRFRRLIANMRYMRDGIRREYLHDMFLAWYGASIAVSHHRTTQLRPAFDALSAQAGHTRVVSELLRQKRREIIAQGWNAWSDFVRLQKDSRVAAEATDRWLGRRMLQRWHRYSRLKACRRKGLPHPIFPDNLANWTAFLRRMAPVYQVRDLERRQLGRVFPMKFFISYWHQYVRDMRAEHANETRALTMRRGHLLELHYGRLVLAVVNRRRFRQMVLPAFNSWRFYRQFQEARVTVASEATRFHRFSLLWGRWAVWRAYHSQRDTVAVAAAVRIRSHRAVALHAIHLLRGDTTLVTCRRALRGMSDFALMRGAFMTFVLAKQYSREHMLKKAVFQALQGNYGTATRTFAGVEPTSDVVARYHAAVYPLATSSRVMNTRLPEPDGVLQRTAASLRGLPRAVLEERMAHAWARWGPADVVAVVRAVIFLARRKRAYQRDGGPHKFGWADPSLSLRLEHIEPGEYDLTGMSYFHHPRPVINDAVYVNVGLKRRTMQARQLFLGMGVSDHQSYLALVARQRDFQRRLALAREACAKRDEARLLAYTVRQLGQNLAAKNHLFALDTGVGDHLAIEQTQPEPAAMVDPQAVLGVTASQHRRLRIDWDAVTAAAESYAAHGMDVQEAVSAAVLFVHKNEGPPPEPPCEDGDLDNLNTLIAHGHRVRQWSRASAEVKAVVAQSRVAAKRRKTRRGSKARRMSRDASPLKARVKSTEPLGITLETVLEEDPAPLLPQASSNSIVPSSYAASSAASEPDEWFTPRRSRFTMDRGAMAIVGAVRAGEGRERGLVDTMPPRLDASAIIGLHKSPSATSLGSSPSASKLSQSHSRPAAVQTPSHTPTASAATPTRLVAAARLAGLMDSDPAKAPAQDDGSPCRNTDSVVSFNLPSSDASDTDEMILPDSGGASEVVDSRPDSPTMVDATGMAMPVYKKVRRRGRRSGKVRRAMSVGFAIPRLEIADTSAPSSAGTKPPIGPARRSSVSGDVRVPTLTQPKARGQSRARSGSLSLEIDTGLLDDDMSPRRRTKTESYTSLASIDEMKVSVSRSGSFVPGPLSHRSNKSNRSGRSTARSSSSGSSFVRHQHEMARRQQFNQFFEKVKDNQMIEMQSRTMVIDWSGQDPRRSDSQTSSQMEMDMSYLSLLPKSMGGTMGGEDDEFSGEDTPVVYTPRGDWQVDREAAAGQTEDELWTDLDLDADSRDEVSSPCQFSSASGFTSKNQSGELRFVQDLTQSRSRPSESSTPFTVTPTDSGVASSDRLDTVEDSTPALPKERVRMDVRSIQRRHQEQAKSEAASKRRARPGSQPRAKSPNKIPMPVVLVGRPDAPPSAGPIRMSEPPSTLDSVRQTSPASSSASSDADVRFSDTSDSELDERGPRFSAKAGNVNLRHESAGSRCSSPGRALGDVPHLSKSIPRLWDAPTTPRAGSGPDHPTRRCRDLSPDKGSSTALAPMGPQPIPVAVELPVIKMTPRSGTTPRNTIAAVRHDNTPHESRARLPVYTPELPPELFNIDNDGLVVKSPRSPIEFDPQSHVPRVGGGPSRWTKPVSHSPVLLSFGTVRNNPPPRITPRVEPRALPCEKPARYTPRGRPSPSPAVPARSTESTALLVHPEPDPQPTIVVTGKSQSAGPVSPLRSRPPARARPQTVETVAMAAALILDEPLPEVISGRALGRTKIKELEKPAVSRTRTGAMSALAARPRKIPGQGALRPLYVIPPVDRAQSAMELGRTREELKPLLSAWISVGDDVEISGLLGRV